MLLRLAPQCSPATPSSRSEFDASQTTTPIRIKIAVKTAQNDATGLAPWRFTLAARTTSEGVLRMPRPWPWGLTLAAANTPRRVCGCHGREPRRLTFPAEDQAPIYQALSVKLHGASPWHLGWSYGFFVAASVILHGARPWHPNSSFHRVHLPR